MIIYLFLFCIVLCFAHLTATTEGQTHRRSFGTGERTGIVGSNLGRMGGIG